MRAAPVDKAGLWTYWSNQRFAQPYPNKRPRPSSKPIVSGATSVRTKPAASQPGRRSLPPRLRRRGRPRRPRDNSKARRPAQPFVGESWLVAHSRSLAAHAVHYCGSYSRLLLHRRISGPSNLISFVMCFSFASLGPTLFWKHSVASPPWKKRSREEDYADGNGTPRFPVQPSKRHVLSRSCSSKSKRRRPGKKLRTVFFSFFLEEQTKVKLQKAYCRLFCWASASVIFF